MFQEKKERPTHPSTTEHYNTKQNLTLRMKEHMLVYKTLQLPVNPEPNHNTGQAKHQATHTYDNGQAKRQAGQTYNYSNTRGPAKHQAEWRKNASKTEGSMKDRIKTCR